MDACVLRLEAKLHSTQLRLVTYPAYARCTDAGYCHSSEQAAMGRFCAGALPWLKDPFDPEGEPLQHVLSSSILVQLGREAMSLATMSCLAVLLVHLPIKLAAAVAPSLFPFSFHALDTVTEVPADMLLLHVCLPFTIPHLHVR